MSLETDKKMVNENARMLKVVARMCLPVIILVLVWQVAMTVIEHDTDIGYNYFTISRIDIGRFGTTTYGSESLWGEYHEDVNIFRFFGTTVDIGVDQGKRVSRIQYMPKFGKHYSVYLQDDGTVDVSYYLEGRWERGLNLEPFFIKDFEWAEEQVRKARKRYAHLIPQRFKDALGID